MRTGVGRARTRSRWAAGAGALLLVAAMASRAHAGTLEDAVQALGAQGDDRDDKVVAAVQKLAALDDARALPALDALCDVNLRLGADGKLYIWDSRKHETFDPMTKAKVDAPRP